LPRLFLCGAVLLVLSFPSQSTTQRRAQACLNYEPDVVTLTGIIRTRSFPGPPNFESVAKGDERENVWVLRLRKPICVTPKGDTDGETKVIELQIVLPRGVEQAEEYSPFEDRRVTVTGTLFRAETGHHHAKVLITVTNLKKP